MFFSLHYSVQHFENMFVSQVDEYLRQCGKKLDDLLPRPLVVKVESVQLDEETVPDEGSVPEEEPVPLPDRTYQSTTTGRVRKRPERLQVSHKVTGPELHCPMCETFVYSKRALTYHIKVCKNRLENGYKCPEVSQPTLNESMESINTSESSLIASDGCPRTLEECPVSTKRPKITESPQNIVMDAPDIIAEVSSELSDQFSEMSDECSEWDEVDAVEIKMEYDEDFVKVQEVAMQTDEWCPEAPSTFFCVPCRCQFRTGTDLRQHALDAHRECADSTLCTLGGRPSKGIKMVKFVSGVACYYECPYCRTLRVDVAQLLRHMRQQHPSRLSSASITCRKAPVKMMKSVQLSKIKEERYFCGFCRKHMDNFRLLKLHLESLHLVKECQRCLHFFQVNMSHFPFC